MKAKHKNKNQWKRAPEKRGIPPLPHSLSDTAYGQTHFSPNRHNANDRDTTPTAQGTTLGHLKQGYLEFVAVVMRSLMAEQQPRVSESLTNKGVLERCMLEVSALTTGKRGGRL